MKIHYYFKLKHDIQNDSELRLAKIEVESLIGKEVQEIRNFVDVLIEKPLSNFISYEGVRPQDYISRLPYPGLIQGYYVNSHAIDLSLLINRLAFIKEFYVIVEDIKDIHLLLPNLQLPNITFKKEVGLYRLLPYLQLFTIERRNPLILLRVIPLHTLYEPSDFICDLAYKVQHVDRMFDESIKHIKNGIYHPFSPSSARWHKGIADFIDGRAAPQLYLTHYFFGIRGKFFPRMISALINAMKIKEGEWLLDPFCGCGTMNLEATLKGINNIGVDMQPLFVMITELKIKSLRWDVALLKKKIEELLTNIQISISAKNPSGLSKYMTRKSPAKIFLPDTLMRGILESSLETIGIIKACIEDIHVDNKELEEDFKKFLKLPLAYWMRSMLKKQTPEKIFETYSESLWKNFFAIYYYNRFSKEISSFNLGESRAYTYDVRKLTDIDDEILRSGVDGIITSPPYGTAIDYIGEHVWALYVLDLVKDHLKLDKEMHIGTPRAEKNLVNEIVEKDEKFTSLPELAKIPLLEMIKRGKLQRASAFYKYFVDIVESFKQMVSVLKRDKYFIMIIGKEQSVSANGYKILIELGKIMEEIGKKEGLEHIESIDIGLQKASELGAIPTEHIIIFKK